MQTEQPKVSVIVPIYNAEKYLERTLDCITGQKLREIQIILVDDGSTDSSGAICDEYAKNDNRFLVIHKKNGGVCSARNAGIENANGGYLAFVDNDDLIAPDMYKVMYEKGKESGADIISSDFQTVASDGGVGIRRHIHPKDVLLDKHYIIEHIMPSLVGVKYSSEADINSCIWNRIYKASIIKKEGIHFQEDRTKYEDRIFLIECLNVANSILFIDSVFYSWLRRGSSLSSKLDPNLFKIIMSNFTRYCDLFCNVYDFNGSDVALYWLNAISTIVILPILQNRKTVSSKQMIRGVLSDEWVVTWFRNLQDGPKWLKLVCNFALHQRYSFAILVYKAIFVKQLLHNPLYKVKMIYEKLSK